MATERGVTVYNLNPTYLSSPEGAYSRRSINQNIHLIILQMLQDCPVTDGYFTDYCYYLCKTVSRAKHILLSQEVETSVAQNQ